VSWPCRGKDDDDAWSPTSHDRDECIPNLSKLVPKLRQTLMLPGCGHWTQQERPDEVNAAILEFLKSL
jgi:pimeloyl-ACP methyl ester carboxylesterase